MKKFKPIIGGQFKFLLIKLRYIWYRYFLTFSLRKHYIAANTRIQRIDDSGTSFFGYYGIHPDFENEVVYLKVNTSEIRGSLFDDAKLMVKNLNTLKIKELSKTNAWNWQQGAQIRWVNYCNQKMILFNSYNEKNDSYCTVVMSKDGKIVNRFKRATYTIGNKSFFLLSINYDRLTLLRPDYGYFNKNQITLPPDDKDGIWKYSENNEDWSLIISLDTLKNFQYVESMEGAIHKVNHLDVSPDDEHIIFLHRWKGPHGRYTRLVCFNIQSSKVKILNGDEMTSHCCWLNSYEVLAYCKIPNGNVGYYKFNIHTGAHHLYSEKLPKVDGHPSISPDGKWLALDTYPDLSRFSKLYKYNIRQDKLIELGKFYQSLRYRGEIRVDLHPKWSTDSKRIYFESSHDGTRRLYSLEFL